MNDYPISVLLGIVEGLTEFLPVSSTAHLRIAEALLHLDLTDPYWKMYTVVIQLGAILALLSLFTGTNRRVFPDLPARRDWRPHRLEPSDYADRGCICRDRNSLSLAGEDHRQTSGEHHRDGVGVADRRRGDVGDRLVERPARVPDKRRRANVAVAGHLDWRLPDSLGRLSRYFPIDVDYQQRPARGIDPWRVAGIQLSGIDSDHDRRHGIRPAQGRSSQTSLPASRRSRRW